MQDEKAPSLLEQLTSGLASGDADNGAQDEEQETPPEGETPQEGEGTPPPEGEEEGAEGEEAEGEEEGAEGEEAEGEEAEGDEPEIDPKTGKPPVKEGDPLNDPVPKGTLIPTKNRIEKLIGFVKERDTKLTDLQKAHDTAAAERDEIIGAITESGMDAQRFGVLLDYARGRNSGDPDQMEESYKILLNELTTLATALGMPVPGKNPMADHKDLVDAVEKKQITPELALETALNRNRAAARTKLIQSRSTTARTTQASQQEQTAGTAALKAAGAELAAKDGKAEYVRKAKIVVDMLGDALDKLPPKLWASTFKNAYAKVPAAAPTPKPTPGGKIPPKKGAVQKPQPLRGNKRPSGSAAKGSPKSLLDAVKGAFNND